MDSRRRAWRRSRDDWRAQLGCGITLFVHRNGWNSDTWGPSWAPLLWPRAATPHTGHRTTGCPVCHLQFPLLLPLAAPILSRGSARLLRMAAPRGRAPSATRMWSAGLPDGPAAGRHAFAHCHGLRVTTCSLPPSSLESAFVSVAAAVTSTVASAGAGSTFR